MATEIHKDAFKLIEFYKKTYKEKYHKDLSLNKYALKWGASSVLEDYGVDRCISVIRFFVSTSTNAARPQAMFNNFHEIESTLCQREKDRQDRKVARGKLYEAMKKDGYVS